jgi:hypothetical protein
LDIEERSDLSWLAILAVAVAIAAVVLALIVPGPGGPEGPVAPGFTEAYVWGHAVVIECTGVGTQPERTVFRVFYTNLGNKSAENTSAHYAVHYAGQANGAIEGTLSLGAVPRFTDGNVTETIPFPCSQYGQDVEVYFTWD